MESAEQVFRNFSRSGPSHRFRFRMIIPAFPAFNIYSNIARRTTALGPVSVATAVSRMKPWDVEIIDENNYGKSGPRDGRGLPAHAILQRIRTAEVVGLYGGLTSTIPRLYELAKFYRERGVTTIAGGQHFAGDNIREGLDHGVDYLVLGEGEVTIAELLTVLQQGRDPAEVPGLAFLRDGAVVQTAERAPLEHFEDLPLPDFSLLRHARLKLFPVGWIRGCGMNCEFCTVKGRPRAASPERVAEQVAALLEKHNARHFFIVDDLFGYRREDTMRVCRLLADYQKAIRTRLDLTVQIRLDRAKDPELLRAMRSAGINTVAIGYESPIREELAAMNKKLRPEEMIELTRLYRKAGFLIHGMFIFGYPPPEGDHVTVPARERVRQFRRFIKKAQIDTIQVLLPIPFPGTELTRRLASQHRVFPLDCIGWEYYDGNFPLFMPDPPLTPEELQACIRKIMGRFYRFRNMLAILRNVLVFPRLVFWLHNLRAGWRQWYRHWRNDLLRFGGWIILRRWTSQLRKGSFAEKLTAAQTRLSPPRSLPSR
ncbi:MAG: B12-binding domain-containing radical SAM protein [Verrucomicrobia bacterium]|nr:B12-binding domain-containing radical SAM protein [Verrucomicrobiota bacterium]